MFAQSRSARGVVQKTSKTSRICRIAIDTTSVFEVVFCEIFFKTMRIRDIALFYGSVGIGVLLDEFHDWSLIESVLLVLECLLA